MPGESRCSPREIQMYLNRVSAPLLDGMQLHVEVPAMKFLAMTSEFRLLLRRFRRLRLLAPVTHLSNAGEAFFRIRQNFFVIGNYFLGYHKRGTDTLLLLDEIERCSTRRWAESHNQAREKARDARFVCLNRYMS